MHRGFTLVELVVTMGIVAILGAIAYRSYRNSVIKTDRADAKNALITWAQTLERCYSQYYYYYNASPTASLPDCPAPTASSTFSSNSLYKITVVRTASSYTLTATPVSSTVVANDTQCTTFTIDNTGTKGYTGTAPAAPDPTSCWGAN